MNSQDVVRILKANGWYEVSHVGSHKQFKHPQIAGRVTVPQPKRDIPIGTLKSIEKKSGLKFK
jgi:predicted RNA binding protein YcfA (HicA-like mRNA interferase family)